MSPASCQFEVAGTSYAAEFVGTRDGHPAENWWRCAEMDLWLCGKIGVPPVVEFADAANMLLNPPLEGEQ